MQTEIIISGFGGQGTLYAGQLLAYAAMDEGKHVTWIPSYGPEMRGGTANCTVVISDDEIGSPTVLNPTAVLVMNLPSLDKYESLVKPGGWLIVNESMVNRTRTHRTRMSFSCRPTPSRRKLATNGPRTWSCWEPCRPTCTCCRKAPWNGHYTRIQRNVSKSLLP